MKHTLTLLSGRSIPLAPVDGELSVLVPGITCQGCSTPLRVTSIDAVTSPTDGGRHRKIEAKAIEACHTERIAERFHVGTLVSETEEGDTLFGADEDEAVLNGRARVYGGGLR